MEMQKRLALMVALISRKKETVELRQFVKIQNVVVEKNVKVLRGSKCTKGDVG